MHAYYAAAASAAGIPYAAWPLPPQAQFSFLFRGRAQQHGLVAAGPGAAYGAPVSFLMYHHPAAAYYAHAHASMVAGVPYMAGESVSAAGKGKRVGKTRCVPSGEINFSSGSGDAGSQGSSEKGDTGANQKGSSSSAKRRKSGAANTEDGLSVITNHNSWIQGEPSQAATVQNAVTEPPLEDKERSTSKLLVLAPGRAALTSAAPNLNIGMDPLSASPSSIVQGEVNAAASSQSNASLSQMEGLCFFQTSSLCTVMIFESVQECEELAQKVSELTAANGTLRSELGQLKDCKTMETENKQLMIPVVNMVQRRSWVDHDISVTVAKCCGGGGVVNLDGVIDSSVDMIGRWHEQSKAEESELGRWVAASTYNCFVSVRAGKRIGQCDIVIYMVNVATNISFGVVQIQTSVWRLPGYYSIVTLSKLSWSTIEGEGRGCEREGEGRGVRERVGKRERARVEREVDNDCFNTAVRILPCDEGVLFTDPPIHYMDLRFCSMILESTRGQKFCEKETIQTLATLFDSWPGIDKDISSCNMDGYELRKQFLLYLLKHRASEAKCNFPNIVKEFLRRII
ncbi:DNA-binding protein EMBP-1 [Triticum urartu]|uniref:DNA-binding protein EMBP-1 n=1 Tax=Triticum urartu TaxID=4572 RepID=M7ZP41_TRIUA|nr:DNA-binding protein EMBP-1 [Triticum urartu]